MTPRTSAVIVVHLGGWPARMPAIQDLCWKYGLKLIEDCAQAHGAKIGDRHVGTFSDIAAWSFCQDKIITTGGEGGMVGTDDEVLWRRMWSYKDHGKSWEAVYEREHPPGFRWLHDSFGSNWRGTEMQAAIGRIQYRKLPEWHKQRTENALYLADRLREIPGMTVLLPEEPYRHAFYRLYARLDLDKLAKGWSRDRLIGEVTSAGVPLSSGSCTEVYRETAFQDSDMAPPVPLPNAAARSLDALAFLTHPGLADAYYDEMVEVMEVSLRRAQG